MPFFAAENSNVLHRTAWGRHTAKLERPVASRLLPEPINMDIVVILKSRFKN